MPPRWRHGVSPASLQVRGIPTLIILDAGGALVTADGREAVEDLAAFPWAPPPLEALLRGVVGKGGAPAQLRRDGYLGIYFSAHWCASACAGPPRGRRLGCVDSWGVAPRGRRTPPPAATHSHRELRHRSTAAPPA